MFSYDVTDEALIDAEPSIVYEALLAEFEGETSWWRPETTFQRVGGRRSGEVGAIHEIRSVDKRRAYLFSMKTVEVRRNELIRARYIKGGVRGEGLWSLSPERGATRLSYRWRVRPKNLLNWALMQVFSAPRVQSELMQQGFRALSRYLAQRRVEAIGR